MNKTQSNGENFIARTGSFSTHGSRTGVNLLGWGEKEELTWQQQREALLLRRNQLADGIQRLKKELEEHLTFKEAEKKTAARKALHEEMQSVCLQLGQLRPRKRDRVRPDLGECIIEVVKAGMTKPQWAVVMKQAREMFERENRPDEGQQ